MRTVNPANHTNARPVELQAVVTHFNPDFNLLFVADKTAGAYVYMPQVGSRLSPGDRVQIWGKTGRGLFAPIILAKAVQHIGQDPLPEPNHLTIGQVLGGSWDSQWVEVAGQVRALSTNAGRLLLELCDGANAMKVWCPIPTNNNVPSLVEAQIQARGVAGAAYNKRQDLTGFQLYLNDLADLQILVAGGGDPFSRAVTASTNIVAFQAGSAQPRRVHVRGTITMVWPDQRILLQDAVGAVRLDVRRTAGLAVGDQVSAVGFPLPGRQASLDYAVVQPLGSNAPVQPRETSLASLVTASTHGEFVKIQAELLGYHFPTPGQLEFLLSSGKACVAARLLTNSLPDSLARLQAGALLEVAGVWVTDSERSSGFGSLWLRSPSDVRTLAQPPGGAHGLLWLILLAGCLVCAALVAFSRWLVRRWREFNLLQSRHAKLQLEHRESALALCQAHEARDRIAQDLHDDIIQSLYAVGWGLEDLRRLIPTAPDQAVARVATAVRSLNEIIRQVRTFIGGLEPKAVNGRELKTALKSLAITAGDNASPFLIEVDPAAANRLTSQQATQLLNIAKEAMSNSLRHAQANSIRVLLQPEADAVCLEIRDDGTGFDPQAVQDGHGLRNMAARARDLGAPFEIIANPGKGTCVRVTLHQHTPHESTRN